MKETTEILRRFEELADQYIRELDRFDMEQLTRKPGPDDWSLGQMYLHLIQSALFMQLRNAEACQSQSQSQGQPSEGLPGEKTEVGIAVFAQGGFPPARIHVPASPQYTPPQPDSKEQLVCGLRQVVDKMREVEGLLDTIPSHYTVPHPRFGQLNAKEWYLLVEMHFRHHLRQMASLESTL